MTGKTPHRALGSKTIVENRSLERAKARINRVKFIDATGANQHTSRFAG